MEQQKEAREKNDDKNLRDGNDNNSHHRIADESKQNEMQK